MYKPQWQNKLTFIKEKKVLKITRRTSLFLYDSEIDVYVNTDI